MNSVAFFTYIIKFQLSNWSPSWSTLITYKVGKMGLDVMADDAGWNAFKIKLIWLIFHSLLCIAWGLFDWELGRNIYRLIWPSFMQVCEGFARKSYKSCQVGISHDRPPCDPPHPPLLTDKIIEWIFSQFTFNILWVTLTQKIITRRVLKTHKWFWGDVYEEWKVSEAMTSDR